MRAATDDLPGEPGEDDQSDFDAVIIGAGFSGMYALYRLRELGLSVRAYDEAGDVGGTWWWTRYPGARVDIPGGPFYCYTFSKELVDEWDWTETQPDQPSVLAYLKYVAEKFDLRKDIQFRTKVRSARFDEESRRWRLETSRDQRISAQFLVSAVGTLSAQAPNWPDIPGLQDFRGELYHTGHWPQGEEVTFAGKRVGVIGTGSSGVQVIPEIAKQADHLTIFQRTPQYSFPAGNRPIPPELARESKERWSQIRQQMYSSSRGRAYAVPQRKAMDDSPEQREEIYEAAWRQGGMSFMECYSDLLTDPEANRTICEFVRGKISETVKDPETAEKLMPDYFFGTKRPIMDEGYYEVFNRENVTLVDLRDNAILRVKSGAVITEMSEYRLDMLVLATGYDAITGALRRLNPVGRDGQELETKWREGVKTHLGLMVAGFPNLFMIHGPESPSVLFNMPLGSERQSDWIADCILYLQSHGYTTIETSTEAEDQWSSRVQKIAEGTLFPETESWYTGANIPGKPRQFMIHLAGDEYYERLSQAAEAQYEEFDLT